jgi:Tfp pilus assembly protein PilO
MGAEEPPRWTLDRHIPITLLLALAIQTVGFAYWMGQLSQRVANLEMRITEAANNGERLARVEVQLVAINHSLTRMEAKLEKRDRLPGD